MKIIDCHTHIFPQKIAQKASLSIGDFYGIPMSYDGTIEKLIEICKRNGISKCLVCSVATAPEQVRSINTFIRDSVSNSEGLFFGFAALHQELGSAELDEELKIIEESGLLGIKMHPDIQKFRIDGPQAYKIYERLENKLPILVHAGDKRYNFSNPEKIKKVMSDFPKLTLIAAHFGGWSEWEYAAKILCDIPNLYVDTSSSLSEINLKQAYQYIRAYSPERVLFGTDYPMWPADKEIEYVNQIPLSKAEREMIFYKNAQKLFRLCD